MKNLLPTRESNNTLQHEEEFVVEWINSALEVEKELGISVDDSLFPSQSAETARSIDPKVSTPKELIIPEALSVLQSVKSDVDDVPMQEVENNRPVGWDCTQFFVIEE